MSAAAFALVISTGLLHSIWNIAAKRSGGDDRFALLAGLLLALIWAPVGVWAGWSVLGQWGWREWGVVQRAAAEFARRGAVARRGHRHDRGYTLIDGYAVKVMLLAPVLVDYLGNLFRLPFLLPAAWRDPAGFAQACRVQWRYALVVAVLGPLAYVMVLYAVRMAPLSHVAPAREVSMLFAALLGGRLLGEGNRGLRVGGAVCIALGVAALALG